MVCGVADLPDVYCVTELDKARHIKSEMIFLCRCSYSLIWFASVHVPRHCANKSGGSREVKIDETTPLVNCIKYVPIYDCNILTSLYFLPLPHIVNPRHKNYVT